MNSPLVDLSTLYAVESCFRGPVRDPWATSLAGNLADLFVYADNIRVPCPVKDEESISGPLPPMPHTYRILATRDSALFSPLIFTTEQQIRLNGYYLLESFEAVANWARLNSGAFKRHCRLFGHPSVQTAHEARLKHDFLYSFERLRRDRSFTELAEELDLPETDIAGTFDAILRFSLYARLAGEEERYLNHPIRSAILLPTMEHEYADAPSIAISFTQSISEFAERLSLDEYAALLHELRGVVRDMGLHRVRPGECDREVLREIAARVGLPPRLRAFSKAIGVTAGVVGGLGAVPILGPWAAVAGGAISISASLWTGLLPRSVTRLRWLRWAFEWDIEGQSIPRQ